MLKGQIATNHIWQIKKKLLKLELLHNCTLSLNEIHLNSSRPNLVHIEIAIQTFWNDTEE